MFGVTLHPLFSVTTVHVHGTPSPSRFPQVTGGVTTTDHRLDLTRTVPQAGRMLIRNTGDRLSFLALLPLTKGTTYDDFVRWVRHPRPPEPFRFRGFRSTAALSPDAGYVLRYRMRPGRYVVMDYRTLVVAFRGHTAGDIRRFARPMTVRRVPSTVPARPRAQRLRAGATDVDATAAWLTPRGISLLEDRALAAVAPPLAKRLEPSR